MSTGFAGPATKKMMADEIRQFTQEAIGDAEGNVNKREAPYGKPHDDTSSADSTSALNVGDPAEQETLDIIDQIEQRYQVGIKKPSEQFPGASKETEPASVDAAFDPKQTDPARLKAAVRKELGLDYEWFKKVADGCGIKYAGDKQYKVIFGGQPRGIYDDPSKAISVLNKYMQTLR